MKKTLVLVAIALAAHWYNNYVVHRRREVMKAKARAIRISTLGK